MRASEWLLIAYFAYVALVSAWFFPPWKAWLLATVVTAVIILFTRFPKIARDLLPAAITLVAYREMDWFSRPHDHSLENAWIVWDRCLLDSAGLRAAIESAGVMLPGLLELCYLLVYTVGPVAIALELLYSDRAGKHIDRFWIAYLVGALGSYALFPYFPSDPPRVVFAGQDLPHITTLLRKLNLAIVGGYGIHSSVFPSAHVSCAMGAAWGLIATLKRHRWIGWAMAAYGLLVSIATIYGRYHYAVDAFAGIGVSLVAALAMWLTREQAAKTT